jgi:hypothetical protein
MKVVAGLIFCLFVLNIGCNKHPSPKALVGKYRFSNRSMNDSLFVNQGNTYKHVFYSIDGRIFEVSGTWEYDSIGGEITFRDFSFFNNEGSTMPRGFWHSRVRITDQGEVHLMYSSENNQYFAKK